MQAGLIAGAAAAIVAVFVQLPLDSPSDAFFNSGSVAIGALVLGLIAGAGWRVVGPRSMGLAYFTTALAAGFLIVSVVALAANTQVERLASFTLPLAAVAFAIVGVLTVALAKVSLPRIWPSTAAALVALAIGVGLAGQGDREVEDLSLPPRAAAAAQPTQAPAPSPAAAAEGSGGRPQDEAAQPADEQGSSEDRLVYKVVDGSKAVFTVREQLSRLPLPNDAVVQTSAISWEIRLDGGPSVFEIDLLTMSSDQQFRDRYIRRIFSSAPVATYTVADAGVIPDGFFDGDTVTTGVDGTLSIRGVDVPMAFDVEARYDDYILHLVGRGSFTWDDIDMPPPVAGSVVWVADEVSVQVLLELQPKGDP